MANNVGARDASGDSRLFKTTDTAGVHVPHHNIENIADLTDRQDDLIDRIGEVQATPTANTLLARVKAVFDELVTLNAKDLSTQATLAEILAKVIAAPATEAKQDDANTLLDTISDRQLGVPYTDRGGTITAGGTAQNIANANSSRRYLLVYNDSDEEMRASATGTASATSGVPLVPGAVWEPTPPPLGAISLYGATTGKRFQALEG